MITLIGAAGEQNELGKVGEGNNALWDLPDDYHRFKNLTAGHPVIMGRKTFGTLSNISANRTNIVLTRNKVFHAAGCVIEHTMEAAVNFAVKEDKSVFIIGGGEIFTLGMPFADRIELTRIHGTFNDANAFFPVIDTEDWHCVNSVLHKKDDQHAYSFTYETWEKI